MITYSLFSPRVRTIIWFQLNICMRSCIRAKVPILHIFNVPFLLNVKHWADLVHAKYYPGVSNLCPC